MNREFLVFSYKVPSEPSRDRVYVWRTLKNLGAVYMQQGVALLPAQPALRAALLALKKHVVVAGGKSSIGNLHFLDEADEQATVDEFAAQIGEEYGEFIRNCRLLIDEMDNETLEGDARFSELMESEESYRKFKRWHARIVKRDYFGSSLRRDADEILQAAELALKTFSDAACKNEKGL